MKHRDLLTILFGLYLIWTGLWRSIEASAFKPNSFWFCLVLGAVAIGAGFLFRLQKRLVASLMALFVVTVVLGFYTSEFITSAEDEANFRVGFIMVASLAECVVVLLPGPPSLQPE
ncbi:MAG: hypothetical protein AAGB26_08985 [Planctomycetota bacterium]